MVYFTVAQWSSNTVRDTITRFGAKILEVGLLCCIVHCNYCIVAMSVSRPGVR